MEGNDIDQSWRKSSYSGNGGGSCVEVGSMPGVVAIRDTKQDGDAGRVVLNIPASAWRKFIVSVKR